MAAAQGREGDETRTFQESWLRSLGLAFLDQTPRFEGEVAEVTRIKAADGNVTERRVWRFDERGWPTTTEMTIYANNAEFSYTTDWTYDSSGLPTIIEVGGRQSTLYFLSWGEADVEITSDSVQVVYGYDAVRDVMTSEETTKANEVRRVFEFHDDGSHDFTFSSRAEDGSWSSTTSGTADHHKVRTASQSPVVTVVTTVAAHDSHGNPIEAEAVWSGQRSSTNELTWEIVYR